MVKKMRNLHRLKSRVEKKHTQYYKSYGCLKDSIRLLKATLCQHIWKFRLLGKFLEQHNLENQYRRHGKPEESYINQGT